LIQDTISAYDACIAEVDNAVGQILFELKRLKVIDNTLVVLVSDHGETLDELIARYGYAFDHGEFLYTHQLHIPFIFLLPENEAYKNGFIHDLPVSIVDVLPTILEILDIEPVSSMAGRSFLPVLKGEKMVKQPIFSERRQFKVDRGNPILKGESFSIIDGDWHLITSTQGQELYDMSKDTREIHTVYNSEILNNMNNQLQNYLNLFQPMYGPSDIVKENIEHLRSLGYLE
jgi:arylsulfatase A-like enzyme